MTGQLTPTITWQYWDGDEWVDISEYVLDDSCSGGWGMNSNRPTDRLATPGEMNMSMDNSGGKFDPDNANVLTGWAVNTSVKLTVTYDSFSKIAFYGHITDIQITDYSTTYSIANVTALDWLDYAYRFTITQQSIETYKRGDQVVDTIVDAVGHTPQATEYAEGDYEFEAAFDSMTVKTKAATELNKIVLSEGGYFYNRHDRLTGEKLVFENATYRNGLRTLAKLPELTDSYLLMANSATDKILMAGSATDYILLNTAIDAHMNGIGERYERSHGENILNKVTVTAYPKRTDSTEQTLYSLGDVIRISSGETKTINVRYQNASTKESCNAITSLMIDPVATTDYTMNTRRDGAGTDLTSYLTVSVVFRTAEAEITLTNTSVYTGKITKLQLRGYGVYQDSSIKAVVEDATSQASYSEHELSIEQQYQRDTVAGKAWADKIVAGEKNPRTVLNKVTFIANKSETRMLGFLALDIGDMVKITESALGLANYYYINGIEFSISAGNIITYSWILAEIESYSNVIVEFPVTADLADGGYIDFGVIDDLAFMDAFTVTADIYVDSGITGAGAVIGKYTIDTVGATMYAGWWYGTDSDNHVQMLRIRDGFRDMVESDAAVSTDTWIRAAIRLDKTQGSIYVDGSSVASTYGLTSDTKYRSDDGNRVLMGVTIDIPGYGRLPFFGKVRNLYVYNRYLTDAEVVLDNTTPGCITDGCVFGSPSVITHTLSDYDNLTMTESDKVFDSIGGFIGTPKNSPVSQLIT